MRNLSLLFFSLFLVCTVSAQNNLKLGLRLSPIFSSANIVDASGNQVNDEVTTKAGISFGLMADYNFTGNYSLHTGIHIVNKGFRRSGNVMIDDTSSVQATQNVSITAVEVPVALKLKTPEIGEGWYANGIFGGSIDITAGSSNEWTGVNPANNNLAPQGTLQTQARLVNPVNFSFLFGVGGEYDFGGVGLATFGLVYHRGLTNTNRRGSFQENTAGNMETYRVNYYSLELGYYF